LPPPTLRTNASSTNLTTLRKSGDHPTLVKEDTEKASKAAPKTNSDDEDPSDADVPSLDINLEEAKRILVDYISLLKGGAGVAWLMAAIRPERVERLVALSVGHPATARRTFADREKAWYMLLFQFEGIAEELLARDDWAFLRAWLRGEGDVERYVADLSRPGALTAALNWYRANVHPARELEPRRPVPPVAAPTLGVWSSGDAYLNEAPMLRSAEHVTGPWRYERVEDASHWMQLDQPERVNALLVDFLA